jgi:hydrogenase nickel incorporation protein HypB
MLDGDWSSDVCSSDLYPVMVRAADQMLITKTDLLPYIEEFSVRRARAAVREIRSDLLVTELSAKTGRGLAPWLDWLSAMVAARQAQARRRPAAHAYVPRR